MRTALVKVNLKPDNVFLPISADTPVIDILCPMFDFLTPVQVAVVGIFLQTDSLIPEGHFKRPVMIATEDKLRTTIRLDLAVRLEGLPPQCVQPFLQANFKRFLLIAQRVDFTVRADLEIQLHSGLVIVVGQVQILPANLLLIPTPFVLVGLCRAE